MYSDEEIKRKLDKFLMRESENEWLEFKEARTKFTFKKIGEYFSALSNEARLNDKASGWLILGVENKIKKGNDKRIIVGTSFLSSDSEIQKIKHSISCNTHGMTFENIYIVEREKRVLLFQIPAAKIGFPTPWNGHFYGRNGESLVALSIQEIEKIQRSEYDWTAEICENATINDLDEHAIEIAKEKFIEKNKDIQEDISEWDELLFLEKSKLLRNKKITKAAILLLGKPESVHHLTPNPGQITWRLETEEKAYEHFGPPFIISVEELFKRVRNVNIRIQQSNKLIPVELKKYDQSVILEALNNCIAHQDYTKNGRIIVEERNDCLIFTNMGEFYQGSIEDYALHQRTPDRYRNPFLTQAMVNLNMIDTMGMGIRRMFLNQRERSFPLPEYSLDEKRVRLKIYGKVLDSNYTKTLMENKDLTWEEVYYLDLIQKKQKISKEMCTHLRRKKLIEGRYPNIFISEGLSIIVDKKVQYIRNKAFDDQYYKDFILKYLKKHKKAKPHEIIELIFDKLSDTLDEKQKKYKISNLLQEMSREGLIFNGGGRARGAIWKVKN